MSLRVLVACEMSGRVRDAFAARGWEAWSADLLPSENPAYVTIHPAGTAATNPEAVNNGNHYQGDVRDLFSWKHPVNYAHARELQEQQTSHTAYPWDLIIAHPPCDHLSLAGARWWKEKQADGRQDAAVGFFMQMFHAPSPLVCVENPRGIINSRFRDPDQIVEPFWFGSTFAKKTCLWFRGPLPKLVPDNLVVPTGRVTTGGGSWRTDKAAERKAMSAYEDSEGRKNRARVRSRTLPEVARAMADQWGPWVEDYYAARS